MRGRSQRVGAGRPRTLLLAAAVVLAVLACFPSISAATPPTITSFIASPSSVKVGQTTTVSAVLGELNAEYNLEILDTDTNVELGRCSATISPCAKSFEIPWSSNKEPEDQHFEVIVYPHGGNPSEGEIGASLILPVERFEWGISLEASKNPVTVGETSTLTLNGLEPDPRWTGYYAHWVDETNGEVLQNCWGNECFKKMEFPYSMEADAGPIDVRVEMIHEGEPGNVAGVAETTLYVEPIHFSVNMNFSEPETYGGVTSWLATTTATPPEYFSRQFLVHVRKLSGELVKNCLLEIPCYERLGPGTYHAVVEDESGNAFAATGWWTIPTGTSAEPEEESADGLSVVALGALFAGPSEICTELLAYPGTHFEGGSVSDQYLDCEVAVGKGATKAEVLKAVATAGGGTSVLWFLYEEKTEELTPLEDMEPPEEEAEPWPVPPVGWPEETGGEAELLKELNPQLETDREAKVVTKQCRRLAVRASLPTSDCTELPIFASGDLDVPQATQHDLEAIIQYPPWMKLNYESSAGKTGAGWYSSNPVCKEAPEGFDCDEFPFFSTEQGGESSIPRPSLKAVVKSQNRSQGGLLGNFYRKCGLSIGGKGTPFLNVPMPPGSNVPTLFLCNGN